MTSSTRKPTAASTEPTLDSTDDTAKVADAPATADAPTADAPAVDAPAPVNVEPTVATPAAVEVAVEEDPNLVSIKLAHPLDKEDDLRRLGLEPKEGGYKPHDEIRVTRDNARMLISAGYAQVDPEDKAAVAAALNPTA